MGLFYGEKNKGNQRDTRHAVSFETVGTGADRIARVVPRAVSYDAGVACVVFLNLEDNLHQIGTDVGNLSEDAASDTESSRAERFTNGESYKALTRVVARDK